MKTAYTFITALAALSLVYCKSTKPATSPPPAPPVAVAEPKTEPAPNTPASPVLLAAEKRWPGTSESELVEGKQIFTTKCVRCHKAYPIEEFSEKKWLHEIDDMSPKARLTPEEKLKLTKFVLAYRDVKEAPKQN